jgi:uncharacterized protein
VVSSIQKMEAVPLKNVTIDGGFWGDRQKTNREKTIPAIYRQLDLTGRLDAWYVERKRERPKRHPVVTMFFDSDTGKYIEAVGYSLQNHPDPELEKQTDELIQRIENAQHPDGYLNTYFTTIEPENRWRNLRDWHEMYNAGHLIEGATAYFSATGKRALLDVLSRFADHIDERFGPHDDQRHGYCGHPEIELALVKLYRTTGEQRYLDLAKYFVDERGQRPHYFDLEAQERGDNPEDFWAKNYRYCQAEEPIREQETVAGHAVRACYLYAGVADIAQQTNDQKLAAVVRRLWDDLTTQQMYITGGLGPAHTNEGFTFAYDLPNETAYAETCASIALAFWGQRMFQIDPDGRYIDVMERALYNTVISGVSHEGTDFFYTNPLSAFPHVNPHDPWSGITSGDHYRRGEWMFCPCCPPNVARLVGSIGRYFYSTADQSLYVHLYNQSHAQFELGGSTVQIEQQTNYPWDGDVQLIVQANKPAQFDLALRIPGWCRHFHLEVNGTPTAVVPVNGYVHLNRTWAKGDEVTLSLEMPVERIAPNPQIRQDAGCVALQRGPVVYCLEQVDNGGGLANVVIPRDSRMSSTFDADLFDGVCVITGEASRVEPEKWPGGLYQPQSLVPYASSKMMFKAIPYCFWANREPGEMRVWIREV